MASVEAEVQSMKNMKSSLFAQNRTIIENQRMMMQSISAIQQTILSARNPSVDQASIE